MFTIIFDKYILFLLILMRMSGAILINPLFGRKNVPSNIKVALTLMLSVVITATTPIAVPQITTIFEFVFKCITEFAIGYAIALIMNIFLSSIFTATDLIDMQIGIGMAKAYDPGTNISAPITGAIYNSFLMLLFFASNSHITFFRLLSDTVDAIPCGGYIKMANAALAVASVFGSSLILALKFALPIVAIEFVCEVGMGVLTRAIPSVNVFSVGIQLKLLVGLLVLVLLSPLIGSFCDQLYANMFSDIIKIINLIKPS